MSGRETDSKQANTHMQKKMEEFLPMSVSLRRSLVMMTCVLREREQGAHCLSPDENDWRPNRNMWKKGAGPG